MAGISFPFLQRVVQTDLPRLGRRVGALLAANVAGSTIGAFITGLCFLDWIGTAGTLKLLYAISVGFAVLAVGWISPRRRWMRPAAYAALAALVISVLAAMPDGQTLWARLHGASPRAIIQSEDGSGLSVLRRDQEDFRRTTVYVNGLGQSWIPYGGIHTALGALPAFVHPHPRTAVLIGLGSGDTLFAMAGRRDFERITSVEIIAPQLQTLEQLVGWQDYPELSALLSDLRIRHVAGDGRLYLKRSSARFDIVQADALRPHSAYAGNLYSTAYFSLLKERLNPGGLAVTWAPTPRTVRTLLTVFPHVWHHGGIAIGSDAPIVIDREAIGRRLDDPGVDQYFMAAGVDIRALLQPYLHGGGTTYDPSFDRSTLADINTDLNPLDEFDISPFVDLRLSAR
jgi:spermidine synthase